MPSREPLHRRTLRKALKLKGWHVVSHVNGTVDVLQPSSSELVTFKEEVRQGIREAGYEPTLTHYSGNSGVIWIRCTTPETIAQEGRGAHAT